ncbi:hypothetical protein L1987_53709 [Smallanthus sonchifolius]|uniref:Uncharacterized protein n=1 Tax=Smallanthus sonchifolius TaxID=185202 RepID=A0ACB9EX04_9ASTR|nr:hypothetical protein L1987_53709 [Smallanthus sonchifolius]
MMRNSRTNEKGKALVSVNSSTEANNDSASITSPNTHPPSGLAFLEGNVEEDTFDCLLDMASSFSDLEDFHRAVARGIPETVSNPRGYSMNPNSFQNPQIGLSSNTVNTNIQGYSLLPDCNMSWGQQCVNQGHNAISAAGGVSTSGGESSFVSFNRPQVNRDITGSSFLFHPRESNPVHTRSNESLNQSQTGIHGNFEGSFLSLGIGGIEESVSRSQLGSREVSDKLKEAASNELKMARAWKATGQTFDAGLMGFDRDNSGFSNQFFHENRMTSSNNEVAFHGRLNSVPGSSLQHILHMQQHDRKIRSGDLNHFRDGKPREAVSTELKMVHAQKATGQTLGQSVNAGFMGFQSDNSGSSNQYSNVDRMASTKNEVGVLSTLNSGLGTSPHHILQMQQNDSKNIRSGDLDHYRAFIGNQSAHSGTIGGNSAKLFNSQQHNLNKPREFEKPSWLASYHTPYEQLQYMHSTTANSPNYAGQVISQNATPSQVLGSNMFSQRTAAPQVSWVDSGPAGNNAPFPKRLGVEFNVRNSLQTSQRHLSPMGTSLQTASTGQVCQFPDKGSTRLTDHVLRPPIGRTDGASVSYPVSSQEPFFAHGQFQNALIHLAKGPQGTPSTNASTVIGQSQKPELHTRPHHKRGAVVPHPASCWVQRQKIIHPSIHHSMPKPYIPVTTAQIHPSIPVGSQTQPGGPVVGRIHPVIPCASKPYVPVATAPAVSHITWKDPEATSKLSGYKCYLCKRDLALTSEGHVYQPAVPPPVAILPCGHSFHDQCLQNITPDDQAKDPPCIPCAIGEQ